MLAIYLHLHGTKEPTRNGIFNVSTDHHTRYLIFRFPTSILSFPLRLLRVERPAWLPQFVDTYRVSPREDSTNSPALGFSDLESCTMGRAHDINIAFLCDDATERQSYTLTDASATSSSPWIKPPQNCGSLSGGFFGPVPRMMAMPRCSLSISAQRHAVPISSKPILSERFSFGLYPPTG